MEGWRVRLEIDSNEPRGLQGTVSAYERTCAQDTIYKRL